MNDQLVVYGDIGVDILTQTQSVPSRGQDAKVNNLMVRAGGSAANCAATAARLGMATTFLGFLGTDHFGRLVRTDCEKFDRTFARVQTVNGDTGTTIAIIEPHGERTFYSYRGVNSLGILPENPLPTLRSAQFLHVSGYSFQDERSRNNVQLLMEIAADSGVLLSVDPSYWFSREYQNRFAGLFSKAHVVFPNQEESTLLTGENNPKSAAEKLLTMGVNLAVLKLGSEGSYVATQTEARHVPAVPGTAVVDATGAGDAFCGGFLFGQSLGLDPFQSAWVGNAAASVVIQYYGGHETTPTVETIATILARSGQDSLAQNLHSLSRRSAAPSG